MLNLCITIAMMEMASQCGVIILNTISKRQDGSDLFRILRDSYLPVLELEFRNCF